MSAPLPPYGAPGHPLPPRPRRRKPSKWWFALGGALVVAGVGSGIALFAWVLSSFLETDATVPVDGRPHSFSVPEDGDRMLWLRDGSSAACQVVDAATGSGVSTENPGGTFTKTADGQSWIAVARFSPGSGDLEVTCTDPAGAMEEEAQVGPAPEIGSFVGGIFATILVPLLLGGAGVVILILVGILYATGAPRDET